MSTLLLCLWIPPSFRTVPFAEIAQINFLSPPQKRKRLAEPDSCSSAIQVHQTKKRMALVSKSNEEDKDAFIKSCHNLGVVLLFYHCLLAIMMHTVYTFQVKTGITYKQLAQPSLINLLS